MPHKNARKLIRMGRGSMGIAIPRDWLRFYRLEPGDELDVVSDGNVTIRPVSKKKGVAQKDEEKEASR